MLQQYKTSYSYLYHTFKPEEAGEGMMSPKLVFRGDKDVPGAEMTAAFIIVNIHRLNGQLTKRHSTFLHLQ